MNPETLTIYQLRKIIDAANEDKKDLSIILFALPDNGARLDKNRIKARIANRDALIKRAEDLIFKKMTVNQGLDTSIYSQTQIKDLCPKS